MQPFMRGIMTFDDYNYKNVNDYVLVEEPKDPKKRQLDLQERLEDKSQNSKEHMASKLTEQSLIEVEYAAGDFKHEQITIIPSQSELEEIK